MYYEGEKRYLKDLDWVNIVKSIRELKALTRILLNQHQRQILAFERESVLPTSKFLEEQEANQIQNKVPFEYSGETKTKEYFEEIIEFVNNFSNKSLTKLDFSIIDELADEATQEEAEVTVTNNSIVGSQVSNQNRDKWE